MFPHTHDNYIVVHIQFGDHHNATPLQRETSSSCAPYALPSATPLPPWWNFLAPPLLLCANIINECALHRLLEYVSQTWSPYLVTDIKQVEAVQRRFTKRLKGMHKIDYPSRLEAQVTDSLQKRRLLCRPCFCLQSFICFCLQSFIWTYWHELVWIFYAE